MAFVTHVLSTVILKLDTRMKFTLPLFKAGLNRLCVDDDGREQMTQPNSCYEGVPTQVDGQYTFLRAAGAI